MTDLVDRARGTQRQLAVLRDLPRASPMSLVLAGLVLVADLLGDLADEVELLRARLATVEEPLCVTAGRYDGQCTGCDMPIMPGEVIVHTLDGRWLHYGCDR